MVATQNGLQTLLHYLGDGVVTNLQKKGGHCFRLQQLRSQEVIMTLHFWQGPTGILRTCQK